jgi:hypothetical protein
MKRKFLNSRFLLTKAECAEIAEMNLAQEVGFYQKSYRENRWRICDNMDFTDVPSVPIKLDIPDIPNILEILHITDSAGFPDIKDI